MTDAPAADARPDDDAVDGLVDEIDLIEQQPLEERAEHLARVHDRLQAALGAVRG